MISLGGTVVSTSIKTAGDDFDEALVRYMRKKHNLLIGERTAEEIKINTRRGLPPAGAGNHGGTRKKPGDGALPKTIVVTSDETLEALKEPRCRSWTPYTMFWSGRPPELAADIFDRALSLRAAVSLLSGLDALIEEKTGITTMIAEEPLTAVGHRNRKVHRVRPWRKRHR